MVKDSYELGVKEIGKQLKPFNLMISFEMGYWSKEKL